MTSAADISPGLASALAAASLASQQAQRAADAFDAKAGLSTIPTQHWELLRVAELLTKGLNVAHVQQQQQQHQQMSALGLTNPPPLFLPSLAAHQGLAAPPAFKAPSAMGLMSGFPVGGMPVSVSAAIAGVTSAGLQMALASATQVCFCPILTPRCWTVQQPFGCTVARSPVLTPSHSRCSNRRVPDGMCPLVSALSLARIPLRICVGRHGSQGGRRGRVAAAHRAADA